ncbi:hypothetical protein Tco_0641179 [Tanacetum coccineum]
MITTDSRIEDKKPSRFILPPMDILETVLCVKDATLSSSHRTLCELVLQKENNRPHESYLRNELAFVHFKDFYPKNNSEDIQPPSESASI